MDIELAFCQRTILREIADPKMLRLDVARTYALTLRSSECDTVDWHTINLAIIERWSPSALVWIKRQAWSGQCFPPEDNPA